MTNLKRRVASHKILRFLENNKVIFFFQKKSLQSDHWRLLKKKIAKIEGVASLNVKNKRDRKEIQPLIVSRLTHRESLVTLFTSPPHFSPPRPQNNSDISGQDASIYSVNAQQDLEGKNRLKTAEHICDLLYAPNLILGSDSLKKLADLSYRLKDDSNLIFIGGWDGNQLINHLDSLKLLETPQDIWREGLSCLSFSYARPYTFFSHLLENRKNLVIYSLQERMQALIRSLQERKAQQIKEQ